MINRDGGLRARRRRLRRFVPSLILLSGLAAPAGAVVAGYVLDPLNEQRVPGVEVALFIREAGQISELLRKTTDAEGSFQFAGSFLTAETEFFLVAHRDGVPYPTSTLRVGEQDQIIVEVYEPSEDADDLIITDYNLFLGITPSGLDVAHLVHVENSGERTFVGTSDGDRRHGVEFRLTDASVGVQAHTAEFVQGHGQSIFDTQPLPPGHSQISFTHRVDGERFDGDYVHHVLYPTTSLEIFLLPAEVELRGNPFVDLGAVSFHEQRYRHYRVENLKPGRQLTISLPFSRPLRWALKWTLLALVPAALVAALSLSRSPDPSFQAATDEVEGKEEREQLFAELSAIDDALAGAADEQRQELIQRRRELMQRAIAVALHAHGEA
ncbi:MAG: hypothetical protein VX733_08670 [Candidatus Latescibacterota bacterium]|nr:hypothetical protein [Candidatus Latescibacterota bacterium]